METCGISQSVLLISIASYINAHRPCTLLFRTICKSKCLHKRLGTKMHKGHQCAADVCSASPSYPRLLSVSLSATTSRPHFLEAATFFRGLVGLAECPTSPSTNINRRQCYVCHPSYGVDRPRRLPECFHFRQIKRQRRFPVQLRGEVISWLRRLSANTTDGRGQPAVQTLLIRCEADMGSWVSAVGAVFCPSLCASFVLHVQRDGSVMQPTSPRIQSIDDAICCD